MPYRKTNLIASLDWITVIIYLIMVTAGWLTIYAAGYDYDKVSMFDFSLRAGQQLMWIMSSALIAIALLMIESDWYEIFAYWIYAAIIVLLLVTIAIAPEINGGRSWLKIGPFSIQPAEFAKLATALALSRLLSTYKFALNSFTNYLKAILFIMVPLALIVLQSETGTALVFLTFFIVLYREGMTGYTLFLGFCAVLFFILGIRFSEEMWGVTNVGRFLVLAIIIIFTNILLRMNQGKNSFTVVYAVSLGLLPVAYIVSLFYPYDLSLACLIILMLLCFTLLFYFMKYRAMKFLLIICFAIGSCAYLYSVDYVFDNILKPYQQERIKVALGMIEDPAGAGYNVTQSKIAIGSGGVFGKGFLRGTQTKLKYVPEQDTDFIFCTIGEEEGFFGSAAVMILFTILIVRVILLAERQRSAFHRIYGYCVASVFFVHLAINIGMVTGITPVIGIPLPFFSYGGSSLWAFTALLFVFLRLDASRNDRL